jgi:hypothetical protein
MDTTQYQDEALRQLFRQLPVEKPSENFTARVMAQMVFEAQRIAKRKKILLAMYTVLIPVTIAILSVAGIFTWEYWGIYLWEFFAPLFIFISDTFSSIIGIFAGISDRFVMPGLMFLALLLGDMFLRRYAERRRQWTEVSTANSI